MHCACPFATGLRRLLPKLGLAVVLLGALFARADIAPSRVKLVLATGSPRGKYHQLGQILAARAALKGIDIEILPSGGSVENVQLLEEGKAQLAFVQSDMAHQAARGHKPFDKPATQLILVSPLFIEVVQVLVRSHLYVFTTSELRGKSVALGQEGSGTEQTARAVLEASGVALKEVDARLMTRDEISAGLRSQAIDAAFVTSAVPSPAVDEALREGEARLLFLEARVIDRLIKGGSYLKTSIRNKTYENQPDELPTVGVQALLVARRETAAASINVLMQILTKERKEIEQNLGVPLQALATRATPPLSLPLHPAASPYLQRGRDWWTALVVVLLAAAVIAAFLHLRRSPMRHLLRGHEEVFLMGLVLVAVWMLGSGGLYFFEHNVNENFDSFLKSAWSIIVCRRRIPYPQSGHPGRRNGGRSRLRSV